MNKLETLLIVLFSAASSGGRAMKTLRTWGLEIDEGEQLVFFLLMTSFSSFFHGRRAKGPPPPRNQTSFIFRRSGTFLDFVKKFNSHQVANVQSGLEFGLPAAHVPWGVANQN